MPTRRIEPRKQRAATALLTLISFSVTFLACEIAVRMMGDFDALGQFVLRGRTIRPYKLPVESVRSSLQAYHGDRESRLVYDALLGWAPRPNAVSADGLYRYNSHGLRSEPREFGHVPEPDVLRVEMFGDSFVHGDDVTYDETCTALLGRHLEAEGVRAEVMNFGVSGYGIDQALLHFRRDGKEESAQLVVLGFQAENLNRNLNLLRPLYAPQTTLPFSKPRFLLRDGELELINVPVLSFEQIPSTLAYIEAWDLIHHERFYRADDYRYPFWRRSKFLAALVDELRSHLVDAPAVNWQPIVDQESVDLAMALVDSFQEEAEAAGAQFLVVHLPQRSDLETLRGGGTLTYRAVLRGLDQRYHVVHPEALMLRAAETESMDRLFAFGPRGGHYSELGNRLVADALFEEISTEMAKGQLHPYAGPAQGAGSTH